MFLSLINHENIRPVKAQYLWVFYKQLQDFAKEDITLKEIYKFLPEIYSPEKELELEEKNLYANPFLLNFYNDVKKEYRIIITSDMYLPTAFLESILNKCGYTNFEKIFVSGEIGDNYNADILGAKKYKIKTYHIKNNYDFIIESNNPICSYYKEKNIETSYLCAILAKQERSISNRAYKTGFILGIVFYNFCKWVIKNSKTNQIFFMSRDGYLPYKIVTEILKTKKKCKYIYTSRRALMMCNLNTKLPINHVLNEEIFNAIRFLRYEKVSDLLEFCGLEPDNCLKEIKQAGFVSKDDNIVPFRDDLNEINYKIYKLLILLQEKLYTESKNKKVQAGKYFKKLNIQQNDSIIDVGYFGKNQNAIESILHIKLNGLYFEVFEKALYKNIKLNGYISTGKNILAGFTAVLETFFTSNENSICGYKNGNPIFEDFKFNTTTIESINSLQQGVYDFCKEWHDLQLNKEISFDLTLEILLRFLEKPTLEEVNVFQNFNEFITGTKKANIVNFDLDKIKKGQRQNIFNESFWKQAFLLLENNS